MGRPQGALECLRRTDGGEEITTIVAAITLWPEAEVVRGVADLVDAGQHEQAHALLYR
jgi:hypothetical protein